jgi:hypothetical protein
MKEVLFSFFHTEKEEKIIICLIVTDMECKQPFPQTYLIMNSVIIEMNRCLQIRSTFLLSYQIFIKNLLR